MWSRRVQDNSYVNENSMHGVLVGVPWHPIRNNVDKPPSTIVCPDQQDIPNPGGPEVHVWNWPSRVFLLVEASIPSFRAPLTYRRTHPSRIPPTESSDWKVKMNFPNFYPSAILLAVFALGILQQEAIGQKIITQSYLVPSNKRGCKDLQLNGSAQSK